MWYLLNTLVTTLWFVRGNALVHLVQQEECFLAAAGGGVWRVIYGAGGNLFVVPLYM